ncbi:hypothetical protein TNCV_3628821 [Trichonephila clavipes]|nr:hypothetical protein TNCV_3628821 [Trichonephila clavipes]
METHHPSGQVVSDADCCTVGPGFESGEAMDVSKCIVPVRHVGILNSRRVASPLVRVKIPRSGPIKPEREKFYLTSIKWQTNKQKRRQLLWKQFNSGEG